jgi:hypothetical protein
MNQALKTRAEHPARTEATAFEEAADTAPDPFPRWLPPTASSPSTTRTCTA